MVLQLLTTQNTFFEYHRDHWLSWSRHQYYIYIYQSLALNQNEQITQFQYFIIFTYFISTKTTDSYTPKYLIVIKIHMMLCRIFQKNLELESLKSHLVRKSFKLKSDHTDTIPPTQKKKQKLKLHTINKLTIVKKKQTFSCIKSTNLVFVNRKASTITRLFRPQMSKEKTKP